MCVKNGNWNENATLWVTFRNGPQGFWQQDYILMHHSTVTSLPFLSWIDRKASSDGPQRVWQVQWVAVTQGFASSSRCGTALTWLRVAGDHQLGLQELCWLQYDSAMSQTCLCSLGAPFTHSKLHLTHGCLGHLSYGQPLSQWWATFRSCLLVCDAHQDLFGADGLMDFRSLLKLLYTLLKQIILTFKVSIWN